jgi:predicted TIM-barrel fold metal-dependent hydrolase
MRKQTRRSFLATSAATAAGVGISSAADSEKNWIDSHVHVWTPEKATYPISPNFSEREMKPASFLPTELFAHQKGTGVTRTVLVQMSFYEYDNSFMLDAMANFPGRFGGIGIVNAAEKVVDKKMMNLAGRGVRGFRLYAFSDRVKNWESSEGIQKMWKTGGDEKLAMCCLTDPGALPVIRKMCQSYPDTPVVIDHFARVGMKGTVDQAELDTLLGLAEFPNVYVKTSAYYALGKKAPPYTDLGDMIRQVRDAFGSERCMWGSDCPYQVQGDHTYEASLQLITDRLDFLSGEDKENILRNTAEKLFFG